VSRFRPDRKLRLEAARNIRKATDPNFGKRRPTALDVNKSRAFMDKNACRSRFSKNWE